MEDLKHNLKIEPYPYQREGISFGLDKQRLLIGDEPGLGKCQTLYSLLATPNGFMKMGDAYVGMDIFGQDGNIYQVENIYPQGMKPVYRITFSDGSITECSDDHLWNVRDENRRRRNQGWTTKTLSELIDMGLYLKSSTHRVESGRQPVPKWEIPMCEPVRYRAKSFKVAPYTMGAALGDGFLYNTVSFSLPKEKAFIIDKIAGELPSTLTIRNKVYGNLTLYHIVNNAQDKFHAPNAYKDEFRRLGVDVISAIKFIPSIYLHGNVSQRKQLLAGLMDTDGSCIGNRTVFHTTSIDLAEDIQSLVQSLGGIATIHAYDRTAENKSVEYQVFIRTMFCPFSPESNKAKSWKQRKTFRVTRYIKSVEYLGLQECQCIKVSAPDSLYLTNEYIVTHNTLQSIGIIDIANAYPALVICPSSLKINWQREFEKFTNKKAIVLDNASRTAWPYFLQMGMFHVAIVNYESLRKYFVWDIQGGSRGGFRLKDVVFNDAIKVFRSVIIDESHRVKDPGAQQTIFTRGIVDGKDFRILLSGTPVVNRAEDLVSQLSIMGRLQEFGGRGKFLADYGEEDNLEELSRQLYDRCMIRREKAKVLTQLPDKTRTDLYVEISNREEYMLAEADLAEYLRQYTECTDRDIRRKMRMEALVKFMTLRSLSAKGKVKQVIDFVRVFIASGKPLILFCSLHEIVDQLCKAFPDAVTVTGRDSSISKQQSVDTFQSGEAKLIICSIKAAGVGLTLTASSNVAFVELPWTYADCCQCEDRAHRIGQKDNVTCYYLLGEHTIDHTLYNLIHKKKSIASKIMSADDEIPSNEVYFDELVTAFMTTEQ